MRVGWFAVLLGLPLAAAAQDGGFRSPSGNLHCAMYDGILRCDVLRNTAPPPPRPRGCDLDYGNAFELRPNGPPVRLCYGDTVADQGHPVLPYGGVWERAGTRCTMAPTGVTCTNRQGRGFLLRSGSQELF